MAAAPLEVTTKGISEFRKELKALGKEWPRQVGMVNRVVAKKASEKARYRAASGRPIQRRAAGAIKGTGTVAGAAVAVKPGAATAMANVAFWGVKRRVGWYAQDRYAGSSPQRHPAWIGSSWQVGVAGQGPYAINDAIAEYGDELLADWRDGMTELTARAFPD